MPKYYLAIDFGASSGRHMLGHMEDGRMILEEVYRFENGMVKKNGHRCWDTERLFGEILNGMKKCAELGKIPSSMAIDTWGVDYVLLDGEGNLAAETYGYRDHRTDGVDEKVYRLIPHDELYARTGIQKLAFNTIYQLAAAKEQEPETFERAATLLFLPDYFHYLLTGVRKSEYTNATTGQLVSPETKQWDMELIRRIGIPEKLFLPLELPGSYVGNLKKEIQDIVGFDCEVVMAASHDTASAVVSVPSQSDSAMYISSGTWSLMGVELKEAICSPESMRANLTNEGGYDYRFRYLKNIMGLWMIQSVRHELDDAYSFAQLCDLAVEEKDFPSRVDVDDAAFLAPENMMEAIREMCRKTGQPVPETVGQISAVIYQSLSECYARTADEIEGITGQHYDAINIVGGGSNADYLNRLTAKKTGRTVYAGPGEATAIGNLAVQMIRDGVFGGLKEARKCIFDSFGVKTYEP